DAFLANPELLGAAIYGADGRRMAGFARGTRLPDQLTSIRADPGPGYVDIAVPAGPKGTRAGIVLLRAVTEPTERRFFRYAGLILLVTMGGLVIAVLSLAQAQLARRHQQLTT